MHYYHEHDFSVHAALLHVDSLDVSDITNISAKFDWTHVAKNNIHHIKFKVQFQLFNYHSKSRYVGHSCDENSILI